MYKHPPVAPPGLRARKARSRFAQALAGGELTPLVGRERELERVA